MNPSTPSHRTAPAPAAIAAPARVDSAALLKGAVEVEIIHGGAVYRLRATQTGKLILTK